MHRQQEPPSSPSSAKHLISAPPHALALHHLVDMPLSLPDLAPYSDQHGLGSSHLLPETFSALTAPLFGGAPSDLFLPSSTTPASRLPTEDHLFAGLLPPAFSLNHTDAQPGKTQQGVSGQPPGSRPLEAAPDSKQDRPSHKAPVRDAKRHRDAWEGLLPGQTHTAQQHRGEHQRRVADSPSKPPARRPPLRGANVTARAPQDADSGTDTDGDDDVLQRVRRLQAACRNVRTVAIFGK